MTLVKKGLDWSGVSAGLAMVMAGAGGVWAFQSFHVALKIMKTPIPSWAPTVLCVLLVVAGAITIVMFMQSNMCMACNEHLRSGAIYVPIEGEQAVLRAVREADASSIAGLQMVMGTEQKVALETEICPICRKVGRFEVVKWESGDSDYLQDLSEVNGPGLAGIYDLVRRHEAWREEQE